jgi:hypothetical protein
VKIRIDSADGAEIVEVDFSTMEDDRLDAFASAGSVGAREELKKRRGIDVHSSLNEISSGDIKDYIKWLKNNNPEKYNTIVKTSNDVE